MLFLKELYLLFIHASKYFLIDHHIKIKPEFTDLLANDRIDWTSVRVLIAIKFKAIYINAKVKVKRKMSLIFVATQCKHTTGKSMYPF